MEIVNDRMLLAAWASFGARLAERAEAGVLCPDLGPENYLVSTGGIRVFDFSTEEVLFPGDLHLYATALFSTAGHLESIDELAAFRYGYIHHGSRFGRLVFDRLRRDFALEPPEGAAEGLRPLDESDWPREHRDWMQRRDAVDVRLTDVLNGECDAEAAAALAERLRDRDPDLAVYLLEICLTAGLARSDTASFLRAQAEIGAIAPRLRDSFGAGAWNLLLPIVTLHFRETTAQWPSDLFTAQWVLECTLRRQR